MIQPAVLGGSLDHRVLAADLVGVGWHAKGVFYVAQDVQVRQARFDHDHIGTFADIGGHFAQGFVTVGGVHLVGVLVGTPQIGSRAHRVAEGAVEGTGVLGRVSHDAGVDELVLVQSSANGADAAVHHVAGGHNVHASLGLRLGLADQHGDRLFVQDVTGFVQNAVLAVAGVGVQSHVSQHAQLGELLLEHAHHARNQAVRVGGFAAIRRFQGRVDGREQGHHGDAQLQTLFGHAHQFIRRIAHDAWHGADLLLNSLAFTHKDRVDQVVGGQAVFAHQTAGKLVAAVTAQASIRKVGRRNKTSHGTTFGEIQFSMHSVASGKPIRSVEEKGSACRAPISRSWRRTSATALMR